MCLEREASKPFQRCGVGYEVSAGNSAAQFNIEFSSYGVRAAEISIRFLSNHLHGTAYVNKLNLWLVASHAGKVMPCLWSYPNGVVH